MATKGGLPPIAPTPGMSDKSLRNPKPSKLNIFRRNKGAGKENKDQSEQYSSDIHHGNGDASEAPHNQFPVPGVSRIQSSQALLHNKQLPIQNPQSQQPQNQLSSSNPLQNPISQNLSSHNQQSQPRTTQPPLQSRAPNLQLTPSDSSPLRQSMPLSMQPSPISATASPRVITRKSHLKNDNTNGVDGSIALNNGRGSPRTIPDSPSGQGLSQPPVPQKPETYQVKSLAGLNNHFDVIDSELFSELASAGLPPDPSTFNRLRRTGTQDDADYRTSPYEEDTTAPTRVVNDSEHIPNDHNHPDQQPGEDVSVGSAEADSKLRELKAQYERKLNLMDSKIKTAEAARIAAEAAKKTAEAEKDNAEYNSQQTAKNLDEEIRKAKEEGRQAAERELNPQLQDALFRVKHAEEQEAGHKSKVKEAEDNIDILVQSRIKAIEAKDKELDEAKISLHDHETRLMAMEQNLAQARQDCALWRTNADELNLRIHKLLQDSGQQMDSSAIQETYRKLRGKIELFSTDFFQGPLYKPSSTAPDLRYLATDYYEYIKDPNARPKLVQGYVWNLLIRRVFANDALLWAGTQQWELINLFAFLQPSGATGKLNVLPPTSSSY
jgi:hypothetical protein